MRSNRCTRMLAAAGWVLGSMALMAQVAPPNAPGNRPSPPGVVSIILEGTPQQGKRAAIYYSRPNIKAPQTGEVRKIWGGLVPWDKVWRLGANEATLLVSELPLQIGTVTVPAGAHTLYMVPSESGTSKLVINNQVGQSGTDYDEKQDLARVDLKKDDLTTNVDQLIIAVDYRAGAPSGTLKIAWEKTQYSVPFAVKK